MLELIGIALFVIGIIKIADALSGKTAAKDARLEKAEEQIDELEKKLREK